MMFHFMSGQSVDDAIAEAKAVGATMIELHYQHQLQRACALGLNASLRQIGIQRVIITRGAADPAFAREFCTGLRRDGLEVSMN